jgi:hypothetical protein
MLLCCVCHLLQEMDRILLLKMDHLAPLLASVGAAHKRNKHKLQFSCSIRPGLSGADYVPPVLFSVL